jgi:ACR3 family arsenite efflux pump ArsB
MARRGRRAKRLEELEEIEELATIIVLVVMYPELAKASITEALKAVYGEPPGAAPHA